MTFDDYEVTDFDIDCLVTHSALLARIIQICLGKAVYDEDYIELEKNSYLSAIDVFSVEHNEIFIYSQVNDLIARNNLLP